MVRYRKCIKNRLEELLDQGVVSEYIKCTIIDMSNKVLVHIAQNYDSVRGCKAREVADTLKMFQS